MPFAAAAAVGPVNAFGSIMQQAIPSAPAVIALLNAVTIWGTLLDVEPVHWDVQPNSAHASAMPFCVGVKNGFVVTWLTNTNLNFFWFPKMLAGPDAANAWATGLSMMPASAPAPPPRAVRRVTARAFVCGV